MTPFSSSRTTPATIIAASWSDPNWSSIPGTPRRASTHPRLFAADSALPQFQHDRRMVRGAVLGSRPFIDLAGHLSSGGRRRQQKVIGANAAIMLECVADISPQGEGAGH